MKFGFVIADAPSSEPDAAERALRRRTTVEDEIERREVPGTSESVLACRCFAELTEVDAVLVFLPAEENPLVLSAALEGLTDIVLEWNMPVVTNVSYRTGDKMATAAITMVDMQIAMEEAAERNTVDTTVN